MVIPLLDTPNFSSFFPSCASYLRGKKILFAANGCFEIFRVGVDLLNRELRPGRSFQCLNPYGRRPGHGDPLVDQFLLAQAGVVDGTGIGGGVYPGRFKVEGAGLPALYDGEGFLAGQESQQLYEGDDVRSVGANVYFRCALRHGFLSHGRAIHVKVKYDFRPRGGVGMAVVEALENGIAGQVLGANRREAIHGDTGVGPVIVGRGDGGNFQPHLPGILEIAFAFRALRVGGEFTEFKGEGMTGVVGFAKSVARVHFEVTAEFGVVGGEVDFLGEFAGVVGDGQRLAGLECRP